VGDRDRLKSLTQRIDGQSYPAYRQLKGRWDLNDFVLVVDRVQGDPFAAPSRIRVRTKGSVPDGIIHCADGRVAAEDWLLRRLVGALGGHRRGSGRSGELTCLRPGPEIEERTAIRVFPDGTVEARLRVGLPARGRRVLGREAWSLIHEDLRHAAMALAESTGLEEHVESVRTQRALRRALSTRGLISFVADGSVLPRASGISPEPLPDAVPFRSPESLRVSIEVNGQAMVGMGVPEGVTVIVGGGFHGKSTLLNALQRGHLDHVPGDGRERVVSVPDTVKIRAEDGRRVCDVDISPFLMGLPRGRSTCPFRTDDASGSTSQAAAIVEAVEVGATVLLVDEDTSATNLLVSDPRMRQLIDASAEPITPYVARVRQLFEGLGVSTVIVIGGVADYLGVADTVIGMIDFEPHDLTVQARAVVPTPVETPGPLQIAMKRRPLPEGLAPGRMKARDHRRIRYGDFDVDLVGVETILSPDHAWSVAHGLAAIHGIADGRTTLSSLLDRIDRRLDEDGPDCLSDRPVGDLIRPRRHELAAALNRHRGLRVALADKN
jgi:predicted ABC-class ATPase